MLINEFLNKDSDIVTEEAALTVLDSKFAMCMAKNGKDTIIFYQSGQIDHDTHVPGPVSRSSSETEYNSEFSAGTALAYFRMLIHELFKKYPDIFPEEYPLIVLDSKFAMCMAKNG